MPRTEYRPERVTARKQAVQERSRATVETILEGAAQVLERRGYARTTTDMIAERAGVSVGSLYQYFPNKDAILLALAYCHGEEARAALVPALSRLLAEDPPLEVGLRDLVRVCVELNARRPGLHRVLFAQAPLPVDFVARIEGEGRQVVEALARYLSARPEVTLGNPELAAHLVVECLGSVIHQFVIDPPPGFEPEDCERELVELLRRYLAG